MKLKVDDVYDGRVYLEDAREGGVEMDISARSGHIVGMHLQKGDFVEVTIKKIKKTKPVKKKKSVKKKK